MGGGGGPTLLMLAYRGGEGGKNGEKDAYVICECSLRTLSLSSKLSQRCAGVADAEAVEIVKDNY